MNTFFFLLLDVFDISIHFKSYAKIPVAAALVFVVIALFVNAALFCECVVKVTFSMIHGNIRWIMCVFACVCALV